MLDQAFEALSKFDWGQDTKLLAPINEAIVATHGDAAKRKELEERLVAALKTELPLDARQFVCRKLMVIGTAACVPALAALLPEKQLSHMARFALERITAPEAAAALRDALPKLSDAAGSEVTGTIGDPEPLMAIEDAVNLGDYDEIIISTHPPERSNWLERGVVDRASARARRGAVEEGGDRLAAALAAHGIQSVADGRTIVIAVADDRPYDVVRDAVADLGLPLSMTEVWRRLRPSA